MLINLPAIKNLSNDTDLELLHAFIAGSDEAYAAIYRRYFVRLRNEGLRKTGDAEMAKDVVQEIFIKFYLKRDSLQPVNLEGYLYTLLKNKILDYYRSVSVRAAHENEMAGSGSASVANADCLVRTHEMEAKIRACLASLPEQCRRVFQLRRNEELSNREIAETLGISVNTVEQHMRKALKILREKLDYHLFLLLVVGMGLW